MKEIEKITPDKEQAIVAQHTQLKLIGRQDFVPGLPLWQLNVKTRVIEKAKIINRRVVVTPKPKWSQPGVPFKDREIVYDVESSPDLVFIQAINKKNAARKFGKAGA